MILEIIASLALGASSQKERCKHADYPPSSEMICVDRNGHCVDIAIDGHKTSLLMDETVGKRVHAIKHGEDVCWQVTQPVSTKLRISAKSGGLRPSFVGKIEKIGVNLYPLADFDPKVDSRLDSLNGVDMKADGDPNGTWQMISEKPLKAGEYVAVFRVFGVDNWDRQAVLLTLDPAVAPAPAGQ